MNTSNALQDILKASKAGIDSLRAVQKRGEEDLAGVVRNLASAFSEQGQTLVESVMGSIKSAGDNVLKLIGAAETKATGNIWERQQKAVELINQGLKAIEEHHGQSIQQIHAKTDADIAAIRQVQEDAIAAIRAASDDEEKHLMTFAQEFELAFNLKERKGGD